MLMVKWSIYKIKKLKPPKGGFKNMAWAYLILGGLFEVGFTTCLKLSNNFTNVKWSVGFFICITLSFLLLNKAVQTLPIGTSYAVWTGIGAAGSVLVGIFLFKEPSDFWRIFFLFLLIGSILGLKLAAKSWVSTLLRKIFRRAYFISKISVLFRLSQSNLLWKEQS